MKDSLVSVLIPVYNVEAFIFEALESISKQTYCNLEIIVVDDSSTDGTYQVASKISETDSRFKIFKNSRNLKIAKTLNFALSIAKGEYIARMDGDDVSEIDRIHKKVEYLINNPNVDLVGCSIKAIDTEGKIIGETRHFADFEFLKKSVKYVSPCSHIWVARKELYHNLSGYRDIPGAEDYDFLLRAITSGYQISNLQDYFGYRVRLSRNGNTSSTIGLRQRLLQSYVYSLYKERINVGFDSHSKELMEKATSASKYSNSLFLFSNKYLMKSIHANGIFQLPLRIIYLLLSACSPQQLAYLISRFHYKIMCRKHEL